MAYNVKARAKGNKTFWFVTHSGGLNRLRIHAASFADKAAADAAVQALAEDNPDYDFKAQEA